MLPNRTKLEEYVDVIRKLSETRRQYITKSDLLMAYRVGKYMDSKASDFMKTWAELASNNIIISIGSANVAEQQFPNFARSDTDKYSILNIDANFANRDFIKIEKSNQVNFLPLYLNKDDYPLFFEALKNLTQTWVASGRNVILMSHVDPYALKRSFMPIIENNINADNFIVIGSYHEEQPVIIYKKEFFKQQANVGQLFRELYATFRSFDEKTLDELSKQYHFEQFGKIYLSLDKINSETIQSELSKNNNQIKLNENNNNQQSQVNDNNNYKQSSTQTFWNTPSSDAQTSEEPCPKTEPGPQKT